MRLSSTILVATSLLKGKKKRKHAFGFSGPGCTPADPSFVASGYTRDALNLPHILSAILLERTAAKKLLLSGIMVLQRLFACFLGDSIMRKST
jgi:hypothetical protein